MSASSPPWQAALRLTVQYPQRALASLVLVNAIATFAAGYSVPWASDTPLRIIAFAGVIGLSIASMRSVYRCARQERTVTVDRHGAWQVNDHPVKIAWTAGEWIMLRSLSGRSEWLLIGPSSAGADDLRRLRIRAHNSQGEFV